MKVTSSSSASTVQSPTAALERQVCAYHIASQLDRKDIFRKQFGTSSTWLPVEKWCHVPGELCLQSWEMPPQGSGFLLENNQKGVLRFPVFFSLSLILQLLCRVSEGEAKGEVGVLWCSSSCKGTRRVLMGHLHTLWCCPAC